MVKSLAARFKMNDFSKRHTKEETAEVYRQSKIVVNVSGMITLRKPICRCYEAMAAGAVLLTEMPDRAD